MIPVGLQASQDGVTFGTALVIEAHKLRVYPTYDGAPSTNAITGRKYPKKFVYLIVEMIPAREYFNPADDVHGADAEDNWEALKEILAAPFVRIYNDDPTNFPLWDGEDHFNSSTNANLVLLSNSEPRIADQDGFGTDAQKIRTYNIEFITRDHV